MRVLLLNPPTKHGETVIRDNLFGCFTKSKAKYVWPPINLALLGSILKSTGVKPKIIDLVVNPDSREEGLERIKHFQPDYIIVVTATASYSSDCDYIMELKHEIGHFRTIFIGNHVTLYPEKALSCKAVDYVIIGEPEMTLKEMFIRLSKNKTLRNLRGIAYNDKGKIINNGPSEPVADMDSLPFADRDLIPKHDYFNPLVKRLPYTTMNTSRGCPFSCIYCAAGITYGKRYRARSARNVVDEIEICVKKQGYKQILFRDEEFTLDKKRIRDICKEILKRKIDIRWICNSRIDTIDYETLALMKKAGCHMIKIGVESGSDKMLKMMKKGINVKTIRDNFKLIKKQGIDTVAHFIIGLPGETLKTLDETKKLVFEIEPDYVSFNIAVPYPGTELYGMYSDKIKQDDSNYDIENGLVKASFTKLFCNIPEDYLEEYYRKIHREFYFRPRYIFKKLISINSIGEALRYSKAGLEVMNFTKRSRKYKGEQKNV